MYSIVTAGSVSAKGLMRRKYGQRYIKYELTEHGYNAHGEGDAAERCARHEPKVISQTASRIVSIGSR